MSKFYIGQKIICIYKYSFTTKWGVIFPQYHEIYTVRAHCPHPGQLSILLQEIVNTEEVRFIADNAFGEPSWAEEKFRPLQDLRALFSLEVKEPA